MIQKIWETVRENIRKDRLLFAIRIIVGVIVSIVVADRVGIEFAPSTGVITLLTIDETKKDTFRRSILRIISFIYTYIISWIVLDIWNLETTLGFSIAIALVTLITFVLRWDLTLSVNCVVLIQLFLDQKAFTVSLFFNETGRVLIGILTANLVNYLFHVKYDNSDEEIKAK